MGKYFDKNESWFNKKAKANDTNQIKYQSPDPFPAGSYSVFHYARQYDAQTESRAKPIIDYMTKILSLSSV